MSEKVGGRVGSDLCDGLGPLPEPAFRTSTTGGAFDRQQMRNYALLERDATRQRIVDACGSMLVCPCCAEQFECADDCTFAADCPVEAVTLECLRGAVRA